MPMSTLLNIAIAEPSAIIRSGLEAVLKRLPGFRIQIIEIATAELLILGLARGDLDWRLNLK